VFTLETATLIALNSYIGLARTARDFYRRPRIKMPNIEQGVFLAPAHERDGARVVFLKPIKTVIVISRKSSRLPSRKFAI